MDVSPRANSEGSNPNGIPAIQPYLSSVPAFTEEDVRTFVSTHPVPGGSIRSVGQPAITRILFMPTCEASELIHAFIGWREQDLVCYVELKGTFTFHAYPPGSRNIPHPAEAEVVEIFDARTGNCLVVGFLTR
jgi:hypothetical protein